MYLKLDLKEDEDFRKHVKELMDSQVRSMIRQEVGEASKLLEVKNKKYIDDLGKKRGEDMINKHIDLELFEGYSWHRKLKREYENLITERVDKVLSQINLDEIKNLVAEKIKDKIVG